MAEVTADVLHDEDDVGIMVLPNFDSISIFFFQVEKNTHRVFNEKLNEISSGSQVRNIINDDLPLFIFLRNFLLCIYANSKTGFFLLLLFL